ncbi:N-acetyltransferase [Salininema proteolyticum]|uniref:N-acetyltransferase n=1 Tax=Salininema proteolyticum TaxID=1607685 RepID=A0ABV8TVQ6_9ACTN
MPFTDLQIDIPQGLSTDEFVLRPITTGDAEMDYEAVMESRDYLRKWEQSTWPEDDFTVAANLKDLQELERRHSAQQAFTYTVVDPPGTRCLGCVYFMAPNAGMFTKSEITPVRSEQWEDYEAMVYFWVRKSHLASGTDRALLDSLRPWIDLEWKFQRRLFITNEQFTQQVDMIERAGLQLRFTIKEPDNPGTYLAYE